MRQAQREAATAEAARPSTTAEGALLLRTSVLHSIVYGMMQRMCGHGCLAVHDTAAAACPPAQRWRCVCDPCEPTCTCVCGFLKP